MNDERRAQSIGVLSICVRVVPVSARLLDLKTRVSLAKYWADWKVNSYFKVVCKLGARRNGTLRYARWAVHVVGAIHEQAMEMQRCRLVTKLVVNVNDDSVAEVHVNCWDRPLAIDTNDRALKGTIRVCSYPANVEIVGDSSCLRQTDKAHRQVEPQPLSHGKGEDAMEGEGKIDTSKQIGMKKRRRPKEMDWGKDG